MPPKARITSEMVIESAFEIAREKGIENVNARTISKKLGCSTQPVMYYFKTIEDIKKAVYEKANQYHTHYILNFNSENIMKDMGMNYIRFATTEKNLFRLIFQNNELSGKTMNDLINDSEASPILEIFAQELQSDIKKAKLLFKILSIYVHGYASFLANNSMEYDENEVSTELDLIFNGIVYTNSKGENDDEKNI